MGYKAFEQCGFAAVCSDISGIEQAPAVSFHLKSISIIRRMIDQMRRYPKRAKLKRRPTCELDWPHRHIGSGHERSRSLQNAVCCCAKGDRQIRSGKMCQSPMIDVTMGQNQSQQIAVARKPLYRWMNAGLVCIAIQRQSQIQQNPATPGSQFDAGPADLFRPTMNANAHNRPQISNRDIIVRVLMGRQVVCFAYESDSACGLECTKTAG